MGKKIICLDTGILIDFYRKTLKEKTFFHELAQNYDLFSTSVITQYEIFVGSKPEQDQHWQQIFSNFNVLPITSDICHIAIEIRRNLKKRESPLSQWIYSSQQLVSNTSYLWQP